MLRYIGLFVAAHLIIEAPAEAAVQQARVTAPGPISDDALRSRVATIVRTEDLGKHLTELDTINDTFALTARQRLGVLWLKNATLLAMERYRDALKLAENTVRQFPDYPESYQMLADAAFWNDDFAMSADALIEVSRRNVELVNQFDSYSIRVIANQLASKYDEKRSRTFARRMFDAGWVTGGVSLRSGMGLNALEDALEDGDLVSANRYLMQISSPATLARILTETRYAQLHAAAKDWAGDKLEKQWPIYLEQTRSAWLKSRTPEAAQDYVRALQLAEHDRTIVNTFLPILNGELDPERDYMWKFIVAPVASALAQFGRWDEAFALHDRLAAIWVPGQDVNSINISASRAVLRLQKGDFAEAAGLFDAVLKEAEPYATDVTPQTMVLIKSFRLCARHHSGRETSQEADRLASEWAKRLPGTIARLQVCLGQTDKALQTWIGGLEDPDARSEVIAFAQPRSDGVLDSDFARKWDQAVDDISRNDLLVRAVSQYGVRRSWKINDGAPREVPAEGH